ncbi:MAG: cystathionine beta-synthase [Microthrixaceae bacterium]
MNLPDQAPAVDPTKDDLLAGMDVADPLDLIGNTPMVRLTKSVDDPDAVVLAKCEWFNPGGSIKDRPALEMILDAEERGLLKPGSTIVEATSGNTGVGLALVAARRGYKCIFVMPDKMSDEKFVALRSYGAQVVACPTAVAPEDPRSYYSVADRLVAETPGAWKADQYHNPTNPLAHYKTTGPEIWRQTAGRITHLVAGAGTGGTISGIARYLKEQNPDVVIVAADPEGSVYSGGTGRPYMVEGVGEDFWPTNYEPELVDRVIAVSDADSFETARKVAQTEGLLVGGSSGLAVHAATKLAKEVPPDSVIVVILPDSGRNYLSRFLDDDWMVRHGFIDPGESLSAGDVVVATQGSLPELVHTHPDETVAEALAIMDDFDVDQLPVLAAEPPVAYAEVLGTVRREVLEDISDVTTHVSDLIDARPETIGEGESAQAIGERVGEAGVVLVLRDGKPVGLLGESDLTAGKMKQKKADKE